MPSSVQPNPSPSEREKHRQLNKDITDMVSAITHRAPDFHKSGSTHHHLEKDEEHGLSMVTLAGNTDGASLRCELDDKSGYHSYGDEPEALNTFVNSNFQAINNSIMFGGGYQANEPGVQLDISDFSTESHQIHHNKEERHGKKGQKIEKRTSKPKDSSSS